MGGGNPINIQTIATHAAAVTTGSADATGLQAVAADPYRTWGIFVQNTDATETLKVGTVTGDAVFLLAPVSAAVNTPNSMFLPGTGPMFLKSLNGTLSADYALFWY